MATHYPSSLNVVLWLLHFLSLILCVLAKKREQMNFLAHAFTPFPAAYAHLMLLPLCMSIWPPGPLVTAGWQVQGQARGERAAGSSTSLGIKAAGKPNVKRGYAPLRVGMPPQRPPLPRDQTVRASFEGCGSHMGSAQTETCCVSAGTVLCAVDKWV